MKKLLDANAILRFLLNDIEDQALIVENEINNGSFTISEVLCEVIYVLYKVYGVSREDISNNLLDLINKIDLIDKPIIKKALELFKTNKLDYVDCLLISRNIIFKEKILSFDKELNKNLI